MEQKTFFERVFHFFDKFEDRVRLKLSRYPILYALVGGVGIVLFWKGVWESAEYFDFLYGPGSIIASLIILLAVGLFVSYFIGDSIIISGLRGEKKVIDKEEEEIFNEEREIVRLNMEMKKVHEELHAISGIPAHAENPMKMDVVTVPVESEEPRNKRQKKSK